MVTLLLQGCDRSNRVEVKKTKIGNNEIAYYTRGNGEPLVMIMGFRGTMAIWDPALLKILEKKYKLILFDNRGAGLSTNTDEEVLTISQMASDTAQLIKNLGYERAHILGWSMGARIAMETAIEYPELVDCLILCAPNAGGAYQAPVKSKANDYREMTSQDISLREGLSLIFPNTIKGHKASASFVARLTKAIILGDVPDDLIVNKETISRQEHALKLWDQNNQTYEALPTIKNPTLLTTGIEDVLDDPDNVRIVANQIPFAWSAYFPGAGHDFLSQNYDCFARLVMIFIETNKKSNS